MSIKRISSKKAIIAKEMRKKKLPEMRGFLKGIDTTVDRADDVKREKGG